MLMNDTLLDCGPAMVEHARMAKAAIGATPEGVGLFPTSFHLPSDQNTEDWYSALQTFYGVVPPLPGNGVDNKSMLMWLYNATGGVFPKGDDITEWGFAEIDVTDIDGLKDDMVAFRGVLCGVSLTPNAESEFEQHVPWTVTPQEQPDPQMGHDILLVEYDETSYTFVTWGALQKATVAWEQAESGDGDFDAWVIITAEDAERNGVDLAALKAEIEALGGTDDVPVPPSPAPAPEPAPEPAPPSPAPEPVTPPVPDPGPIDPNPPSGVLSKFFHKLRDLCDEFIQEVEGHD
jgi:hypothetical protein